MGRKPQQEATTGTGTAVPTEGVDTKSQLLLHASPYAHLKKVIRTTTSDL